MADRSAYDKLFTEYTKRTQALPGYQEALTAEYNKKTGENKDLIAEKNALEQEMYSTPSAERERYYSSAIRNPLAQESLISGKRANIASRLGAATDILTNRGLKFEDILKTVLAKEQADITTQQTQAESAWRDFTNQQAQEEAAASRKLQQAQINAMYGSGGGGGEEQGYNENMQAGTKDLDFPVMPGQLKKLIGQGYNITVGNQKVPLDAWVQLPGNWQKLASVGYRPGTGFINQGYVDSLRLNPVDQAQKQAEAAMNRQQTVTDILGFGLPAIGRDIARGLRGK